MSPIVKSRVTGTSVLDVLENMKVDFNLPKHKKEPPEDGNETGIQFADSNEANFMAFESTPTEGWGTQVSSRGQININGSTLSADGHGGFLLGGTPMKPSLKDKVLGIFKRKKKLPERKEVPVQQMFINFKQNTKELEEFKTKSDEYLKAIEKAKENGQTALADELTERLPIVLLENVLFTLEQTTYIDEEDAVKFIDESSRHVRMDYIANFARVIPEEVIEVKKKMDENRVFDNYAILHYDPLNKGTKLTKKEKERKKDPIMFGLIRGSRRLYYIGDWEDEHCDLTLDEMVKVIPDCKKLLQ